MLKSLERIKRDNNCRFDLKVFFINNSYRDGNQIISLSTPNNSLFYALGNPLNGKRASHVIKIMSGQRKSITNNDLIISSNELQQLKCSDEELLLLARLEEQNRFVML